MGNETFYSDGLNLSNKKLQPDFVFILAATCKLAATEDYRVL